MAWRAFYADGRRWTSAEGRWEALPREGLVVAVWWDDQGQRHLECGGDAMILIRHQIISVNLPTIAFNAAAELEANEGRLKFGELMPPDAWAQLRAEADDARELPAA